MDITQNQIDKFFNLGTWNEISKLSTISKGTLSGIKNGKSICNRTKAKIKRTLKGLDNTVMFCSICSKDCDKYYSKETYKWKTCRLCALKYRRQWNLNNRTSRNLTKNNWREKVRSSDKRNEQHLQARSKQYYKREYGQFGSLLKELRYEQQKESS